MKPEVPSFGAIPRARSRDGSRRKLPIEVSAPLRETDEHKRERPLSVAAMCRAALEKAIQKGFPAEWQHHQQRVAEERRKGATPKLWKPLFRDIAKRIDEDEFWVERACDVIIFGNRALHDPSKVSSKEAMQTQTYTRYVLSRMEFDVRPFGGEPSRHRVRLLQRWSPLQYWEGPFPFGEGPSGWWLNGGLVDIVFACPYCGSRVYAEDVSVRPGVTDPDHEPAPQACPHCDHLLDLSTWSDTDSWSTHLAQAPSSRQHKKIQPVIDKEHPPLPPIGEYFYRFLLDATDAWEFE